jgi:predicted nuclease of restriction endonuclease-like (RecB) superfamily
VRSTKRNDPLYTRIREILESARSSVARSVNTTQVVANWLIGQAIVEEEQAGRSRAAYGQGLLQGLSSRLVRDFGRGWSVRQLEYVRSFYLEYGQLLEGAKTNAARSILGRTKIPNAVRAGLSGVPASGEILHAPRVKSSGQPVGSETGLAVRGEWNLTHICDAARQKSWRPGMLHPNLSWTHYRTLLRVEQGEARSFYEIEAIKCNWSARELERQINSLLYERLAMSKDKKGLLRLAAKGHEVQTPADVFKDPVVMEFLGLPASPKLVESDLEQALIDNLQAFLLELGKGFAFVSRQERITLDGDHFYIDLVFYHTFLKCFILLDLKVGKLTHQDLGQLQLYVNYYDRERLSPGDNPTLGLILCTDKNDAVVRYTLAEDQAGKIFASRYKLHVPSVAELKAEIRRELKMLRRQEGQQ